MSWTVLDLALGLLALIALAVLCLRLWRQTKALARETSRASAQLAQARTVMSRLQDDGPAAAAAPVNGSGRGAGRRGARRPSGA